MSFVNYPTNPPPLFPKLPPEGFPVRKTPIFTAWEHKSVAGFQYQTARQVYPNWDFQLQYGDSSWLREQTQNSVLFATNSPFVEFEALSQLFLKCLGSYGEFWYDDPEDDSRTGQIIAIGNGSASSFRIMRTWGIEPLARLEPVGGVNLGNTIAVYLNGVVQLTNTYTVTNDLSGSHLNFATPPAAGAIVSMDFSFYFRCRWKEDSQQYDQWAMNLWQYGRCEFRSVKP